MEKSWKNKRGSLFRRASAMLLAAVTLTAAMPAAQVHAIGAESAIAVGIDVSKYQGDINWPAVASQGVSFAFVKVGSSKSGLDPKFDANFRNASACGIRTGVYIYSYATSVEGAAAEAQWVVDVLKDYPVSFPVVIDIEDKVQKSIDPGTLSLMANTFCTIVEAEGYYPMVYSGRNFFRDRLSGVAYDRWVAQYAQALEYEGASIWQATQNGSVAGINGNVDVNYLFKDYSGLIIANGWLQRKGSFYFYENYKMKRGWIDYAGNKYYTDPAGRMVVGWQQLDDKGRRYFREDGIMSVNFTKIGEDFYYFDKDGYMQTGWIDNGGYRFLLQPDGIMYKGWYNDGAHQYYFNAENGSMTTGLAKIGENYHYFDKDGYMQTGFVPINEYTFFFDTAGVMQKGWLTEGGNRYYFHPENGAMITGALNIDGRIYYFNEKGHMQTGFVDINGTRFYFSPADGSMQTGWLSDGTNQYYLQENGAMAVNWVMIDGKFHHFDTETGAMTVYNWVDNGNGMKFFVGADGIMVTGWQNIGGTVYYFAENGVLATNTQMIVNDVLFQLDETGAATAIGPAPAPVPETPAAP